MEIAIIIHASTDNMSSQITNILIAEDDKDDFEIFESAVQEVCPEVSLTVAGNGVEVLRQLSNAPFPDAIFLDINMPLMGGVSCLQSIRKNPRYNKIPVIMLSTGTDSSEIAYCLSHGANFYFCKPITYQGVKDIVQDLCNGKLTA